MEATRKGTLSDAIEAVSTMDIIDAFDVPNKMRRGRLYLLCPGHDDRHFGSCYVDKNDNGYYCYVCGEHVNKWNLVLKLNGNKKAEACEWFFKASGITPTEDRHEDPYKKVLQIIRQLEHYIRNDVVYNDTHTCDKIDSSYGRSINGEYMYSELSITNPLMDIYKSSKQAFKKIVLNMLDREIAKTSKMMKFYELNSDDCVYVDGVGLIQHEEMADACDSIIIRLQTLMLAVEKL
jgi:hypothetical protein